MGYKSDYIDLKCIFDGIIEMGWVESHRTGPTGIGKTFEDLLGKMEDNISMPDYKSIEVKTQDSATSSMITLFTKSPNNPTNANTYLRINYGNTDDSSDLKILHTTISTKNYNTHRSGYQFKVIVDKDNELIKISIKDSSTGKVVDDSVSWSFDVIREIIRKKLKYIAKVDGEKKIEHRKTYYKYTNISLLVDFSFEKFLNALEAGDILIDIRIGVYKSGRSIGKTHDHGTGFRITYDNLLKYVNQVK